MFYSQFGMKHSMFLTYWGMKDGMVHNHFLLGGGIKYNIGEALVYNQLPRHNVRKLGCFSVFYFGQLWYSGL